MKTVALVSQKGGVGKTTLATGLAVAAHQAGLSAAVFDLDPQASAAFWKDTREADEPAVVPIPAARLEHVLKAARDSGCDFAVIDAPPFAKDITYEAAKHADLILIPIRPAVLDVMAMTKTLDLLAHYGKLATIVLSICPMQEREIEDTEQTIRELGATVVPVRIHNRIAFSRAQQTGLTAQEFEPRGKAAGEMARLYDYVHTYLGSAAEGSNHGNTGQLAASSA